MATRSIQRCPALWDVINVLKYFSAEPLSPDSAIYFKIVSAYSSMDVMVGVTSCKPDTLIPEFLPDNAADLVDREEYWVVDRVRVIRNSYKHFSLSY